MSLASIGWVEFYAKIVLTKAFILSEWVKVQRRVIILFLELSGRVCVLGERAFNFEILLMASFDAGPRRVNWHFYCSSVT